MAPFGPLPCPYLGHLTTLSPSCDSCSHPSPSQLCLPPQHLSFSTISLSCAACNESCGEYFGDQAWVRGEGHLILSKAPIHPL